MAAASGDAPTAVLERLSAYLSLQSPDAICQAIAQALAKDNLSAMQWLYQKSIPVNADLRDGFTGLHLACQFGAVRCTQWLLEKNADPMLRNPLNQNALEISATNTSSEQFQVILDFMESDLDFDLNGSNIRGETLLHLAASAGNLQHTMILLMMGATLNETDVRAETPLHCAAKQGHTKVVSLLLSCGADLNATSTHGKRPLDLATHEETRSVLAKFKQLEPLKYPLHTAIQAGDHLALSLLSRWHDVDQLDTSGFSPLHLAAQTNDITFVLPLLQQGAKVDVHNKFGKTPTDLASDPAIIKMLQS